MKQTFGSLLLLLILVSAISLYAVESTRTSSISPKSSVFAITPSNSLLQETGGEVTKANWQQHPKIKAIRAIVQSVKTGMSRKSLTTKKRTFEYCEPGEDTLRMIATDASGRARFYQNEGGSEDSSLKLEHYYDERGRLRFVFITGGAVNGSQLEHRIYFDETGKRIWEERTFKKGPGYTFPEVWPDEELQLTDAGGKFSSTSPCPEVKQKAGRRRRSGRS
ncbi:MAG: hypothetical protein QOH25_847 [Acidobacteriota bacterium]|jgi:hypothetical protein|nr:hypothetical protein [Acidobacteriota bacterium]